LRLDPSQRFACSQCGRCCRGFDVVVTAAEVDLYRRRNAVAWFDDGDGVGKGDPFETVPGLPGAQRIRKRADGACGFLSSDNRCRIHEELGAAQKPLTCRVFPFNFHSAADGVVVTASFNCPTVAANEGPPVGDGATRAGLESLRKEWFAIHRPKPAAAELVRGRPMNTRSLLLLRQQLLAMLAADGNDLRSGVRRIAATLDDLTRSRVRSLADAEFAEYLSLTVPHAAARPDAPPPHNGGAIARMLQYGFLYAVVAIRENIEHPSQSRTRLRLRRLQLLAHFHRLSPALDRVNVKALSRRRVDINADDVRPIAFHYLRSTIETLGASGRPIIDELSMAVSYLNAACALAAMHADADGTTVDRDIFIRALTEASDVAHAQHPILDSILKHFSSGTDAMRALGTKEGVAN
jgi:Fe-S-cluster containining protein